MPSNDCKATVLPPLRLGPSCVCVCGGEAEGAALLQLVAEVRSLIRQVQEND